MNLVHYVKDDKYYLLEVLITYNNHTNPYVVGLQSITFVTSPPGKDYYLEIVENLLPKGNNKYILIYERATKLISTSYNSNQLKNELQLFDVLKIYEVHEV